MTSLPIGQPNFSAPFIDYVPFPSDLQGYLHQISNHHKCMGLFLISWHHLLVNIFISELILDSVNVISKISCFLMSTSSILSKMVWLSFDPALPYIQGVPQNVLTHTLTDSSVLKVKCLLINTALIIIQCVLIHFLEDSIFFFNKYVTLFKILKKDFAGIVLYLKIRFWKIDTLVALVFLSIYMVYLSFGLKLFNACHKRL